VTSRYFGLIPAAGSGSRFGAAGPKQYSALAGKTVLYHAIRALLTAAPIETVFVVLAPDDEEFRQQDWSAFGTRLAPLYCGGGTRRDSVLNGLIASSSVIETEDKVLVHDAARPCLGQPELRRLMQEAGADAVGGILAVPVADTLKRGDEERRIVGTQSREGLWQAQTPQLFGHGLLLRALRASAAVTDEAGAVEALGYQPRLVEGSPRNIKITYPADLDIAERFLKGEL
jgi:2-C-methyl-D-erythritol 4-phosphate cytidylyltransferase